MCSFPFIIGERGRDHTDLVELSVGAEHERQDMKHFDPYHSSRLVPFSKMTAERDGYCKSKTGSDENWGQESPTLAYLKNFSMRRWRLWIHPSLAGCIDWALYEMRVSTDASYYTQIRSIGDRPVPVVAGKKPRENTHRSLVGTFLHQIEELLHWTMVTVLLIQLLHGGQQFIDNGL